MSTNQQSKQQTGPRELSGLPFASQDELDAGLERVISTACMFATQCASSDPNLSREMFAVMGDLIKKRSPAQRARMEAKIEGLR